jgi:hypothetical protein
VAIESATYISQLDSAAPLGSATKTEGDDELRQLKTVLKAQFPNLGAAAVTPTAAQLNTITAKVTKTGDTYTGAHDFTGATVTVPTATAGTSTTSVASTAFVAAALAAISESSVDLSLVITTGTTQNGTAGTRYALTNVAATTVETPTSPSAGQRIGVVVCNGLTTNLINYNSIDKIMGLAEDLTLNQAYAAVELVYVNATEGWVLG